MKLKQPLLTKLKTDHKFRGKLQHELSIPESTLRYRVNNNILLDSHKAVEFFKKNGVKMGEIFEKE